MWDLIVSVPDHCLSFYFVLIVYLFISYAHINLYHFFSSSWCRGLAVASACDSSWTFLLTFLQFLLLNIFIPVSI